MNGRIISIYFDKDELAQLEKILQKERENGYQGSMSELLRKRIFYRRDKKRNNIIYNADATLLAKIQTLINNAIHDHLAGHEIILTLREIHELVLEKIKSHENHP